MYIAHINGNTGRQQKVQEHLLNVADLASESSRKIGLENIGFLIGLLHDMGKFTDDFNKYIHYTALNPSDKSLKGKIDHSTAGGRLIYELYGSSSNHFEKLTAQLIYLSILSHHGGLMDCINLHGEDSVNKRIVRNCDDEKSTFKEARSNFQKYLYKDEVITELFKKSVDEVKELFEKIARYEKSASGKTFQMGLVEKYIFSCLVDSDRQDTCSFMTNKKAAEYTDTNTLWNELSERLEKKLDGYPNETKVDGIRRMISGSCKKFASRKEGIYQLAVPTGGGKTLSSLRYAIEHAKTFKKKRIIYVVPFTTVIEQNAKEMREILGRNDIVLEHHSNVIDERKNDDYEFLTENWSASIIVTTMVQFLNSLYSGGTQNIRRMHNMADSVIIFDEIQALPIKCVHLFNGATNFLSKICNSTIILCTATQPLLDKARGR